MLNQCFVLLFIMAIVPPLTPSVAAQSASATSVAAEKAAIDQFNAAIERYMALRRDALVETPGPSRDSTSVELTNASDALAAAIQRSRRGAATGDMFGAPVAAVVKRRVILVVRNENLGPVLADIDDDEAVTLQPRIHVRFPAAAQVATMPPSLLAILPPVPKALEYRIVGRYLVLRDVEAALILDYIPDAIPR